MQIPVRLDAETAEELRTRAAVEGKSMNQVIREALETHFTTKQLSRQQLTAAIERVAKRDSAILEALKKL
jgi:plasmid stability protein